MLYCDYSQANLLQYFSKPLDDLVHLTQHVITALEEQLSVKKKVVDEAYSSLFLQNDASDDKVNSTIRDLTRIYHPDKGGSHEYFVKLQGYFSLIREARSYPNW